jgi:cellulose synthase/poly-beta-1,6-N-acetylglucosamine synthase-like glycosyltransferase
LSVVIPCYNEAKSLVPLFEACLDACNERKDIQFIFVNNGSNDDTQIILDELLTHEKYFIGKSVLVYIIKFIIIIAKLICKGFKFFTRKFRIKEINLHNLSSNTIKNNDGTNNALWNLNCVTQQENVDEYWKWKKNQ